MTPACLLSGTVAALIPAAGSGTRLGLGPKAFVEVRGKSLLQRSVEALRPLVDGLLPVRLRPILYVLQWAASVLLLGLVVWYGALLTWEEYSWESLSPGLGYPTWIYLIWLPVLCLAIIWRLSQSMVERCRICLQEGGVHES